MKKRNYKFTNKHHPPAAIASVILGTVSLLGMGAAIYLSFLEKGGTKPGYGLTGLLAVVFSIAGLISGALSLKERDCFHIFGWIGAVLNTVVLLGTGYLFSLGFR